MKISVLTPTYNRSNLLDNLYKSLIENLNYGVEIEWLIMNDGSTDNTEEKIKESQGILLKNENGQLLITKETLDNMIKSVVYKFENIENCTPKISIDEQNEISITLQVVVKDDVIIKDLANSLQNKVKEEMKKTSDLDVKNVNIKIINMSKKTNENKE